MKLKRKIVSTILAFVLTLNLGIVAYARDTSRTDGSSFSWSSGLSSTYVSQESTYYSNITRDFSFNPTAAIENNLLYYFTIEHNEIVDRLTKDSLYSNILDFILTGMMIMVMGIMKRQKLVLKVMDGKKKLTIIMRRVQKHR